ncbi:MAG: hypothetical protein AAB460_03145 [Patescibacteria group bacterium]
MRFWRAVGLGVFLLVLSVVMPRVFAGLEEALVSLLSAAQSAFEQAEQFTASPAALPVPRVGY